MISNSFAVDSIIYKDLNKSLIFLTDLVLEQQQILDVAIVSVVERYTVVSLTGAAGVLAPVTMLTVLELDLEPDLVPALLLHVMEGL